MLYPGIIRYIKKGFQSLETPVTAGSETEN